METKLLGVDFGQLEIEKIKNEIELNIGKLSEEIASACKEHRAEKANFFFQLALLVSKLDQMIKSLSSSIVQSQIQIYMLSSLFLKDCFEYLNKGKVESLHFVTGPQIGNISVLDRIVDIEMHTQNFVFARADTVAVRKALIHLGKCEHKLQGCFHIHPGFGIDSTIPSGIDLRLQSTLDRGGYRIINAIFSRDGYIRFYSSLDFKIQIYGTGVERIDQYGRIYRLVEIS